MPRLLEHINFPKTISILATIFGIALGACGLTAVASAKFPGLASLGFIELAIIILSAVGLAVMATLWVIATALGLGRRKESEIQRLFDETDRGSEDDQ